MSEGDARSRAQTEDSDRIRLLMGPGQIALCVLALAMIVVMVAIGASAQGSAGGTGPTTGDNGGDRYSKLWDEVSRKNKRWARHTSACESGGNAKIHGGGGSYHGAFQFMKSTWKAAPKSPGGDPHRFRWKVQAVVAVHLKKQDGAGHWPNCG